MVLHRPEHLVLISIRLALISSFGEQQDCDRVFFGEESGRLHTSLRQCKSSASTEWVRRKLDDKMLHQRSAQSKHGGQKVTTQSFDI